MVPENQIKQLEGFINNSKNPEKVANIINNILDAQIRHCSAIARKYGTFKMEEISSFISKQSFIDGNFFKLHDTIIEKSKPIIILNKK
jgi:hypothetical protein